MVAGPFLGRRQVGCPILVGRDDELGLLAGALKAEDGHGGAVFVHDRLADNLNPFGRLCFGASTLVCTPCSLADDGLALGAQGPRRLRQVLDTAGFGEVRVAVETPFNIILEARP